MVGVDVGGSGSRAVVVGDGLIVARESWSLGGNVSMDVSVIDTAATQAAALAPERLCLAVPGLRDSTHGRVLSERATAAAGCPVTVISDQIGAVLGAGGGDGVVVIASGTGSFAAAYDGRGRWARAGGHGFVLGDEGSAYWIGRRIVRALLGARDNGSLTAENQGLADRVLALMDVRSLDVAVSAVTGDPGNRAALTAVAPVVSEFPEASIVRQVVGEAVDALEEQARTVGRKLDVDRFVLHGAPLNGSPLGVALSARLGAIPGAWDAEVGAALALTGVVLPVDPE
jgi:N-acetylglucosamine kinase-like BadF-type ATPase